MRDRHLYAKLLGIESPWFVRDVVTQIEAGKIEVFIGFEDDATVTCPECGERCGRYETKAWATTETARWLWSYKTRGWALRTWTRLIDWIGALAAQAMVKVSQTLREHLWGIINAIVLGATNAHLESANAKIQRVKQRAGGYRNRARFRDAILFHCGDLELYSQLAAAHTKS